MPKKPRKSKPLRAEEKHVRTSLARDLKVEVEQHDDGLAEGAYDLRIMYPGQPHGPVEVKSHVNGKMLGTLNNLGSRANGGIWVSRKLSRVWVLTAGTAVTVATFWPVAEENLAALETAQTYQFRVSAARSAYVGALMGGTPVPAEVQSQLELAGLGVISGQSYVPDADTDRPGVRLLLQSGGSAVWDGTAESVVGWIEAFAAAQSQKGNLDKLEEAAAAAGEAHLAVFAHLDEVGYPVWRSIEDRDGSGMVPTRAPDLPAPLTHVWLFAYPGGATGLAWSAIGGWRRFLCAH